MKRAKSLLAFARVTEAARQKALNDKKDALRKKLEALAINSAHIDTLNGLVELRRLEAEFNEVRRKLDLRTLDSFDP